MALPHKAAYYYYSDSLSMLLISPADQLKVHSMMPARDLDQSDGLEYLGFHRNLFRNLL